MPRSQRKFVVATLLKGILKGSFCFILFFVLAGNVYQLYLSFYIARMAPSYGQLVDIGGYRLNLVCEGSGSPAVILESGLGDFSLVWDKVQREVGKFTKICSYDRAGLGWSEESPKPRDSLNIAHELHTLLQAAKVQGPYILVGHSLGGVYIRQYTREFPQDVLGMVFIDSAHEEQIKALPPKNLVQKLEVSLSEWAINLGIFQLLLKFNILEGPQVFSEASGLITKTRKHMSASQKEANAWLYGPHTLPFTKGGLGHLPLTVLSAGRVEWADPAMWDQLQKDLAGLSNSGKHFTSTLSGHWIQQDQPDLVIESIIQMIESSREKKASKSESS